MLKDLSNFNSRDVQSGEEGGDENRHVYDNTGINLTRNPLFAWNPGYGWRPGAATADDPALKAALESYHRQGLTSNKKISALLKADYNIDIKDSAVKRRRKELSLMGSRITTATMPYNDALQLIVSEMDDDISGSRGLANVKSRIAFKHGVHLSRDFISEIMHAFDPRGFDHREPGSKKTVRVKKNPLGIHERWARDGHDKLYSIGFPIWGVVDDASSRWLGAWVVLSNRMGSIVAYLFLCLVEEIGDDITSHFSISMMFISAAATRLRSQCFYIYAGSSVPLFAVDQVLRKFCIRSMPVLMYRVYQELTSPHSRTGSLAFS
ncbi:uncharacterized protein LACBIDRAFT_295600, partial [Laccaria bicolor S238N-H82]